VQCHGVVGAELLDGRLDVGLLAAEHSGVIDNLGDRIECYRTLGPRCCGGQRQHSSQADHGEYTFQH
jgi:hypothetical protein